MQLHDLSPILEGSFERARSWGVSEVRYIDGMAAPWIDWTMSSSTSRARIAERQVFRSRPCHASESRRTVFARRRELS